MKLLKTSLLAAAFVAAPLSAQAESTVVGGTTSSTSARLDFRVTIPRVLLLQVGATNAIDRIDFDLSGNPVVVGTGTAISGDGGDQGDGRVTARLLANNGEVTLTAAGTGSGLVNSDNDVIPYTQIDVGSDNARLPAPSFVGSNALTRTITPSSGKVINETAAWTFSYLNNTVMPPGEYTGRITYTASMP